MISPELANYDGNYFYGDGPKGKYRGQTTPVGRFLANAWGLRDMHGNVWEWCLDTLAPYPFTAVTDPFVTSGTFPVLRGGSWHFNWTSYASRSAYRGFTGSNLTNNTIGFRVVLAPAIGP